MRCRRACRLGSLAKGDWLACFDGSSLLLKVEPFREYPNFSSLRAGSLPCGYHDSVNRSSPCSNIENKAHLSTTVSTELKDY